MALSKFFSRCLFLTFCIAQITHAQNENETTTPGVPELPPEELRPATEETKPEEPQNLVVNFDESKQNSGFFSDRFQRGSRSLNILDLSGYLRVRFNYFRNGHLGTYLPGKGGTSMMPPNLSFMAKTPESSTENVEESEQNPSQNNFSGNMRLRIDPTINVSEIVRIKTTVDVFDNMVLGSTPAYLSHQAMPSPSSPSSLMSMSQNPPLSGINSINGAISLKRAWGEVTFPVGELRFGRVPFHWGLGILYNSGDDIHANYGDQVDGIFFETRFGNLYLTPGYHIAYTGPTVRGGGFFASDNFASYYLPSEAGQRYPLEVGDLTHVFTLSLLKRDSDFIANKKREEGTAIFDYGIFTSYRRQSLDTQAYALSGVNIDTLSNNLVRRDSHVGLGSLWAALSYGTFHIEAEAAGIWGKYRIGEKETDMLAKNDDGSFDKRSVWLLQGGIALESRYGFLNDRLQVGLDAGYASTQDGPGFGLREGSKKNPEPGDADGRKLPSESAYKTNFKFNPAYTVDLLLYREILGAISGTFYFKPHLAYFFSRNFGLRGDVITSIAPNRSNTTGNSNWLGVELDANAFLRTESGFYFQLAYGVLFPLKGLNRRASDDTRSAKFADAFIAQTLQAYVGITF